jgi:pyruvate/2-oxoacid:ferredoxin oxidoreductase beta subunit
MNDLDLQSKSHPYGTARYGNLIINYYLTVTSLSPTKTERKSLSEQKEEFEKELDELAKGSFDHSTQDSKSDLSKSKEGKPKQKNKEELEPERFNSLMDGYLEKRRKRSEAEKKAEDAYGKLGQLS